MKMTESKIMKALECCAKNPPSCEDCNYKGKCNRRDCYDYLKLDALDLINRKNAEIENMFSQRTYKALYEVATADINKLQWQVKTARSEAIKEFLNRSKELSFYTKTNERVVDMYSLERIAKEMGCWE